MTWPALQQPNLHTVYLVTASHARRIMKAPGTLQNSRRTTMRRPLGCVDYAPAPQFPLIDVLVWKLYPVMEEHILDLTLR